MAPSAISLRMGRGGLVTAFLAAFGRAVAEVGAILIVGGNIRGFTRTMTTTIALETSKGELALGLILISLSLAVSALAFSLSAGPEHDRALHGLASDRSHWSSAPDPRGSALRFACTKPMHHKHGGAVQRPLTYAAKSCTE